MSSRLCKYQDRCYQANCPFLHKPTYYPTDGQRKTANYQTQKSLSASIPARHNCRNDGHYDPINYSFNHPQQQPINGNVYSSDRPPTSRTENPSQTSPVTMEIKIIYCDLGVKCQKLHCYLKHPHGREIDRNSAMIEELKYIARLEEQLIEKIDQLLANAQAEQQQKCDTDDEESNETDEEQFVDSHQEQPFEELRLQKEEFQSAIDSLTEQVNRIASADRGDKENLFKLQRIDQQLEREFKRWQSRLPIYARRRDIIEKLRQNQVLILKADTGSGKSTQVVQYLCDAHFADSSKSIFCLRIFPFQ